MRENLPRMDVEPIPKNQLSPQMIKSHPATAIHKDPQAHQPMKTDYVENGQEGQSEPSQQLNKDLLHQREDVDHQRFSQIYYVGLHEQT